MTVVNTGATNSIDQSLFEAIAGCILGTALGDAAGLKREGLSRTRSNWMYGESPKPDLLLRRGVCSDDTEHTLMVGCAMLDSGGDCQKFESRFRRDLRCWLMTLPPGTGLGTLKAVARSFVLGPAKNGVKSAGNGPAMRSALLGILAQDDTHLHELVLRSTRATHTDPRAFEGAWVVAKVARFITLSGLESSEFEICDFLKELVYELDGNELKSSLLAIVDAIESKLSPRQFAEDQGWENRVFGYINQTVPAAVYCWAHARGNFEKAVSDAIMLGGDSDSVGAIVGALMGAEVGRDQLPASWLASLGEWPRTKPWMDELARLLAIRFKRKGELQDANGANEKNDQPEILGGTPSLMWGRTFLRNLFVGGWVVGLCIRRWIPIPSPR